MNGSPVFKNIVLSCFLFILTASACLFCYRNFFWGGQSYEFCHYGEIARNIVEGRGFSTSMFYPSTLAYLDSAKIKSDPYGPAADRFPLQAYWVALFERLAGPGDAAVAAAVSAAHALWVIAVFLLGQLYFSRRAAFLAAVLWAINPMMTAGFDLNGYPDVLFGLLFFIVNCGAASLSEKTAGEGAVTAKTGARLLLCGFAAGLAYLARFSLLLWLPLYAGLFLWKAGFKNGARNCAWFFAGFLLCAAPWGVYSFLRTGFSSPPVIIWNLADKVLTGMNSTLEYRTYAFSEFLSGTALSNLAVKWAGCFASFIHEFPSFWFFSYIFPFAVAWFFFRPSPEKRLLAGMHWVFLAWQAVLFSFLLFEPLGFMNGRYYLWFAPMALLQACDFVLSRGGAAGKAVSRALPAGFVILNLAVLFLLSPGNSHPSGLPLKDWPELEWIRNNTSDNDLIMTNLPAQIAWYCRRKTVNITKTPAEMPRLLEKHCAKYIYISNTIVGEIFRYQAWQEVFDSQEGGGKGGKPEFKVLKTFDAGAVLAPAKNCAAGAQQAGLRGELLKG